MINLGTHDVILHSMIFLPSEMLCTNTFVHAIEGCAIVHRSTLKKVLLKICRLLLLAFRVRKLHSCCSWMSGMKSKATANMASNTSWGKKFACNMISDFDLCRTNECERKQHFWLFMYFAISVPYLSHLEISYSLDNAQLSIISDLIPRIYRWRSQIG